MNTYTFNPRVGAKVTAIFYANESGSSLEFGKLDGIVSRLDPTDEFENVEVEVESEGNYHWHWFYVDDIVPFFPSVQEK